jgi:acetyl esterase/lipase
MTELYRGMNQASLDAGYNNSAAVQNSAALTAEFDVLSQKLRQLPAARIGLRYGPAARQLIDYFPANQPGPLVVFIHGGYWQMRAKENFSFIAKGLMDQGLHVALVGYTLAPDISLAGIVDEVRSSIAWLAENADDFGGDPTCMLLSGWSAGAHLVAMCMGEPGVIGGLAISGIFDLEPVRLSYVNHKLGLKPEDVPSLSPLHMAQSSKPMLITYGQSELPELQRQSETFYAVRKAAGMPSQLLALPGLNHFTILHQLSESQGALAVAAKALCASQVSSGPLKS